MNILDAAAELRWLFRDSEGDMGLRSNFAGMVAALEAGAPPGGRAAKSDSPFTVYVHKSKHSVDARRGYSVDERQLKAAENARVFRSALLCAPIWAQIIIHRAREGLPPEVDPSHRLIADLTAARQEHRRSRSKRDIREWLERQRRSKDQAKRRRFLQLREQARDVLDEALAEYARMRGREKDV